MMITEFEIYERELHFTLTLILPGFVMSTPRPNQVALSLHWAKRRALGHGLAEYICIFSSTIQLYDSNYKLC